jgi:hypothetical protein
MGCAVSAPGVRGRCGGNACWRGARPAGSAAAGAVSGAHGMGYVGRAPGGGV